MAEPLRVSRALLALGLQADRPRMVALFAATVVGQIAVLAATYAFKLLVDAAVQRSLTQVLAAACLGAGAQVTALFCGRIYIKLGITIEEKSIHTLDQHLIRLTAGVPTLDHHERPAYMDKLSLLRADRPLIGQMANAAVLNLRTWVQLAGSAVLLARLHPLLLTLPLFGVASILTGRKAHAIQERVRTATAEPGRLKRHLFTLATSPAAGKEIRVFGLDAELAGRHDGVARRIEAAQHRAAWQAAGLDAVGSLGFAVGYIGAVALVFVRAVRGEASAGDVALVIGLAAQMNATVSSLVSTGDYLRRVMKAGTRYLWLMDYATQSEASLRTMAGAQQPVPAHLARGIDLVGVSFRYPGADPAAAPILENVDLHLPAGKLVALVGENGAGKTTIVKLLSRFYTPSRGGILVDGVPLSCFDVHAWRDRISAGFQDFVRFELLARETVGIGDLPQIEDREAVAAAVARAGAEDVVAALPHGLETQLGRTWPAGVELSGGQWQKLALARAGMRTAPLLILLDEPTAALDAPTEFALFSRLAEMARRGETWGAVTLIVSHRFSTVRVADLIVVLNQRRVVESGTHDELMRRNGLYAELYALQARAYR